MKKRSIGILPSLAPYPNRILRADQIGGDRNAGSSTHQSYGRGALRHSHLSFFVLALLTGAASLPALAQSLTPGGGSGESPDCYFEDPLSIWPPSPSAMGVETSLDEGSTTLGCGSGVIIWLDGIFRNSISGSSQRVVVTANRPTYYDFCVGSACESALASMRAATDRLASRGHAEAAGSPNLATPIAIEVVATFQDPCVNNGESQNNYVARAQDECRQWVKDRLPFYVPKKLTVATTACNTRAAGQVEKHASEAPSSMCK